MKEIEPKVNALARRDEIAEAVADRLRDERRLTLTWWQRVGATVVSVAAVADVILRATGS